MGQYVAELPTRREPSSPRPSPARGRIPLEQAITWTPATPKSVFVALRNAWNANAREMGGPATTQAVAVLLAQWAVETEEGRNCWNWNLPNIKCANRESQYHFYMSTMEDLPAARANAMVGAGHAAFRGDKDEAAPGRLRVWIPGGCFRHWFSLRKGAAGYLATLRAFYGAELAHVRKGDPAGYATAIFEQVRGKGRGFYNGPAETHRDGKLHDGYAPAMKLAFNEYMKARPTDW